MKVSHLRLNKVAVIAAEEMLKNCGVAKVKVVSDSMSPFIKIGDTITFTTKNANQPPKYGNIILCKQKYNGSLLIHRFIFKYRREGKYFYVTKADKGFKFDYPSSEQQYLGIAADKKKRWLLNKIIIIYSVILFTLFFIITKIKLKDWSLS